MECGQAIKNSVDSPFTVQYVYHIMISVVNNQGVVSS